jgi:outer membrane protein OmpA-like peptidoglycan-associated protein
MFKPSRPALRLLLSLLALGSAGCAITGPADDSEDPGSGETPRRAAWPAYTSAGVKRGLSEGVSFAGNQWELTRVQRTTVKSVATVLKVRAERVIVAGGSSAPNAEYARQLGQQRALAVMEALIEEGIPANKIMTVSFGRDLPGRGGDRVEFGFVPTGERNLPPAD